MMDWTTGVAQLAHAGSGPAPEDTPSKREK